jgi:hypothetical protein
MLRVEHMIKQVRRQTDNELVGTDAGISDEEIIRYLNDGQDDIYAAIAGVYRGAFSAVDRFSCVGGSETYAVPTKAFMGGQTSMLEWSQSGADRDYRALKHVTMRERAPGEGYPCRYSIASGLYYVWNIPTTALGTFRATYTKLAPTMDKRRGVVSAVTIVGSDVTTLSMLAPDGSPFTQTYADAFTENDVLSIVSSTGLQKCYAIRYTAVSAAGVVTLDGNHTLETGETVTSGDFIVVGEYATTNSMLPQNCERYIIGYAVWKILKRDSSSDYGPQQQEVGAIREVIIDGFAELSADIDFTPFVNNEFDW